MRHLPKLRALCAAIRDGWLILGVALALLFVLEGGYRAQAAVRRMVKAPFRTAPPAHPYADSTWFASYQAEWEATFDLRWKPFVYFRRAPFAGELINVGPTGHRRTVAATRPSADTLRVFFFGGSTMWGDFQRDHRTIPSLAATHLAAHGFPAVEVTNFGESGYIFTQEVVELLLQLRSGARPDVVVFYDGINDVAATVQNGRSGVPQNENRRREEFQLGRTLFSWKADAASELRVAAALVSAASRRSLLMHRLWSMVPQQHAPPVSPDSAAADLRDSYVATAGVVEALAVQYGFRPIYVWQPSLHASGKRPTPFEESLVAELEADPYHLRLREVHRRMPALLASPMAALAPGRYVDASRLFERDSSAVFVDVIGHTTEAAVGPITDRIMRAVLPVAVEQARLGPARVRVPERWTPGATPRVSGPDGRVHEPRG